MDTSHDWAAWVIGAAALAGCAAWAVGWYRALRDRVRERLEARALESRPLTLPADLDAAVVSAPPRPAGGTCRYCDRAAGHRAPRIVVGRPRFDGLLRRIGVVGALRLELRAQDYEGAVELCAVHWERARALCAVEIGEAAVDYARWLDGWVERVHAFQGDGLAAKLSAATAPAVRNGVAKRDHTWGAGA